MSYDERISRVCEYIGQNLDEELSLDQLSSVADESDSGTLMSFV